MNHKRAFTSNSKVPTRLLEGFGKIGLEQDFLKHVKNIRPSVYKKWMGYR
jgi:putative serine/threonine protein kinase